MGAIAGKLALKPLEMALGKVATGGFGKVASSGAHAIGESTAKIGSSVAQRMPRLSQASKSIGKDVLKAAPVTVGTTAVGYGAEKGLEKAFGDSDKKADDAFSGSAS